MRSLLSNFSTEKLKLRKATGEVIEDIEALVEPKKIFVDDSSVIIEEGDFFERTLTNGSVENYEVLDRGFYKGAHGIPDHYQVSVRKTTARSVHSAVTYNFNNNSGKVNINSKDNSTNISITLSEEDKALFDVIESLSDSLDNQMELVKAIQEMKEEVGKPKFAEKYNAFIQSAANHMTLFSPFIPALTKFLVR